MNGEMRLGLIGLGKAGLRHASAVRKSGEAQIVAVADPGAEATQAAAELGVPCMPDYEVMLQQIELDAVIISVPHSLLTPAALTSARHGKHILLEKPVGVTVEEARSVVDTCRKANVRLMVNFVHRFRPEYHQARAALRSGTIGRSVLLVDIMTSGHSDLPAWVWRREMSGGGMMMYNGIHSIDRLAWLADSPIVSVTAVMGTYCHPGDLEDALIGTVVFQNGCIGAVVQHKSDAKATRAEWQTLVHGTRGALKVLAGTGLELVSEREHITLQTVDNDRFLGAFQEFVKAVREGRDPSPSGEDGVRALGVVLALYEAARTGRATTIEAFGDTT